MKLQLRAMRKLLQGDTTNDITMWCIEGGIKEADLIKNIEESMSRHERVLENPGEFLNMDEDDRSIVKHILHQFIKDPLLVKAKKSIWRKMVYFDSFTFNVN